MTEAAAAKVRAGAKAGSWRGHTGAVSGVAVDAVNKTMVSAGVDGLLVFWAFKEKRADGAVAVGSGVSQLELVSGEGHRMGLKQYHCRASVPPRESAHGSGAVLTRACGGFSTVYRTCRYKFYCFTLKIVLIFCCLPRVPMMLNGGYLGVSVAAGVGCFAAAKLEKTKNTRDNLFKLGFLAQQLLHGNICGYLCVGLRYLRVFRARSRPFFYRGDC